MTVDEAVIGRKLGDVRFPVEAGKIFEFATAVHEDNPAFFSAEEARHQGYESVPAPPTFAAVRSHFTGVDDNLLRLGLDPARVLLGGRSWIYHRVPVAGDELRGETRVADVYTKRGRQGGSMTFVEIETRLHDALGEPVITERATVIETAEVVAR